MRRVDGIAVGGDPLEESALKQIQRCARTADRAALMADHHKGYAVPIGGVVALADKISPSGVGEAWKLDAVRPSTGSGPGPAGDRRQGKPLRGHPRG